MPLIVDYKLQGMREIESRMAELGGLAGPKLLLRTTRRSMIPLRRKAADNALAFNQSGALSKSVTIVTVKPKGIEAASVQVGPKKKHRAALAKRNDFYKRKDKGVYYGHLVEFGHRIASGKKGGYLKKTNRPGGSGADSGGMVRARPWFVPAWNSTRNQVIPEFKRILVTSLKRMERRKARQQASADGLVDP